MPYHNRIHMEDAWPHTMKFTELQALESLGKNKTKQNQNT